jgi:hypothetical protein
MERWNIRWGLLCSALAIAAAWGSIAAAQYFYEDPNLVCGPGQLWYRIDFDAAGKFISGQGWGYGAGWYYYPLTGVYRQWYYRGPCKANEDGCSTLFDGIEPLDPNHSSRAVVNFIWTRPGWSAKGLNHPPLPDDLAHVTDEALYVGAENMHNLPASFFGSAERRKNFTVSGYSPEWVGVEITGANVKIMRWVAPQCADGSVFDFGDAPDSYGTSLANDGARHALVQGVYLGQRIDSESDARPGYDADGDDTYGQQDEDGVTFLDPLAPGCMTTVQVTASVAGYINAWIDFNKDGSFGGSNEHVFADMPVTAGVNQLCLLVPAAASGGTTYARFRFNLTGGLDYKGLAQDGEVEDYKVHLAGECGVAGSSEAVLMRDSFDDNAMGRQWSLDQKDAANVWIEELDGHLSLRSTASASGARAQYMSNYWKLDASGDFSLSADYQYQPVGTQGWLSVRLTPSVSADDADHIDFDVGSSGSPQVRYESVAAGGVLKQESASRVADSGTLYLSYSVQKDELYLSLVAYGKAYAWKTVSGVVKGRWGGAPLNVAIGGKAGGLALGDGQAYFDNFVVEAGTLSGPVALFRFWSARTGRHFYTLKEGERRKLIDNYADDVWACEGVSYHAFADAGASGLSPVYRFWSVKNADHFYTIKEGEKTKIVNTMSATWQFEGIAFYAYPAGDNVPASAKPVYRFWAPGNGAHFFTMSEGEKNKLINQYSATWTFEGIAWYAFE